MTTLYEIDTLLAQNDKLSSLLRSWLNVGGNARPYLSEVGQAIVEALMQETAKTLKGDVPNDNAG